MQETAVPAGAGRAPFRRETGTRLENDALRRKLVRMRSADRERPAQAVQCWRLALARAARDAAGLDLAVERVDSTAHGLHEMIELLPERPLLVLLRGPAQRLGMMALSPELTASLIESQTIGRVHRGPAPPRRPTRIDAAMVAGWVQRALGGLNAGIGPVSEEGWARGYHYDSFVDNARAMELLLEERAYRTLVARVSLAGGARKGVALLALPEAGEADGTKEQGPRGAAPPEEAPDLATALALNVLASDCRLDAVLARISLPLSTVLGLQPGLILPLANVTLDNVSLEDVGGRRVAQARLGQQHGLRALRVNPTAAAEASDLSAPDAVPMEAPDGSGADIPWPADAMQADGPDLGAGALSMDDLSMESLAMIATG